VGFFPVDKISPTSILEMSIAQLTTNAHYQLGISPSFWQKKKKTLAEDIQGILIWLKMEVSHTPRRILL
jgi:hypothetical protein